MGTGVDDSSGYDVQNLGGSAENVLEDSTALTAVGTGDSNNHANHPEKRQANKIGAGIYDLGTGVDDGSGYDVQNLGGSAENVLEDSTALTAVSTGDSNNHANHPERRKRSPRPQLGNDAGGAEKVFDGMDSGAGQGVENGMDNAGTLISNEGFAAGALVPSKDKRQLGNDAGGAQAIFDGIDSGAGQGLENGMDNAGTLISNEGYAAGNLVPSKA